MPLDSQRPTRKIQVLIWLLLGLVALCAYWGHWRGEFVYDDVVQIQGNGFLRSWAGTWQAMGEDVWAFKGERAEAWSNYWRPTFVAWLALNYRLFGVDASAGWHWSSFLLHWLACGLGLHLLLRAGLRLPAAAAAAAVFAVHPAHVESVGWISGSPDPLMACLLLASLLLLPRSGGPRADRRWLASLTLYSLALLTKEVSVLAPLLVVALDTALTRSLEPLPPKLARAAPFAALALGFVTARRLVLGTQEVEVPWDVGPLDLALTVPHLVAFYLRQALLPVRLSPSYPLRSVEASQASAGDWVLLLAVLSLLLGALYVVRRRRDLLFLFCLFLLPLIPALNVGAFHPEQLVHDRYLYLPLLGFWGALALVVHTAVTSRFTSFGRAAIALALACALSLAIQTRRYLPVWSSAVPLWQRAVEVDPGGAFSWALYGQALAAGGRTGEARSALDRSIALFASPLALTVRADLLLAEGDLEGARRDLSQVVAAQPTNTAAIERLAATLQRGGALAAAEELLRAARQRLPYHRCTFTTQLGVVLYLQGRKAEALAELESLPGAIDETSLGACQLGLFHLASLYAELGREEAARAAYARFAEVTRLASNPAVLELRRQARTILESVP